MEEKNFTNGKKKNWRENCSKNFRMWVIDMKWILFKEALLIFI